MGQISNLNGTNPALWAESAPSQSVAQAKPNFRTPAALLARLSGVGKFTSPFKPALMGRDSHLARVADQFARRPLGDTPAGKLASDMLALADSLAVSPTVSKGDLGRLDALRAKAEQSGIPSDARDFCNTLARTVLLRPLNDALAGLPSKETRTQLADALHGLLDHLYSAKDEFTFLQASAELSGLKETFRTLGKLGANEQGVFEHLEEILAFRQDLSEGLEALASDVAKIAQGQTPSRSVDECFASASALGKSLYSDPAAPALARMESGPMGAKAQHLAAELACSVSERASGIADRMTGLATAIRAPEADLTALNSEIAAVKGDLNQKAGLLSSDRLSFLQGMGRSLEGTLHASTLVREADALMGKEGASPEELHAMLRQFGDALSMPELDTEDAARLNTGMEALEGRLSQTSREHLETLTGIMDGKTRAIQNGTPPAEVRLDIDAWTKEAETFLLPGDKVIFEDRLAQLIRYQDEALHESAALLLKGGVFDGLGEDLKATLTELCLEAGCHPSLIRSLQEQDAQTLTDLLHAYQNILDSRVASAEPQDADIRALDAHFLRYPELDDVASALLRKDGADYRFDSSRMLRDLKAYMERTFSSSLLKSVSLPGTDTSDISFLAEVVACAAKARLTDKAQLQQIDFSLIQALWYCHKANDAGLSFATFKAMLPEPYKSMPLLQEYMDAGISGRRALKSLGSTLSLSSQGMGTRWALMGFLTEAQAQNVKWSAGLGLKGLYEELKLREGDKLEGRFSDVLEGEKAAGGKDAVAAVDASSVDRLRNDQEHFEEQARTIAEGEFRTRMAERLGMDARSTESLEKGATLAACVLLLDKVLNAPGMSPEVQQSLVRCMDIQSHIKLDKGMVGSNLAMISDTSGRQFRNFMKTMKGATDQATFLKARQDMLDLLNDLKLTEKAEAVFYFKNYKENNPVEAITKKLWDVIGLNANFLWADGDSRWDIYDQAKFSILGDLKRHGVVAGTGHVQNLDLQKHLEDAAHVEKEADKRLRTLDADIERDRQERITKIVSLALCEQITLSTEFSTLEQLQNAIDQHKAAPEEWSFYQATHARLLSMGLPKGTADLFLRKVLHSVDRDFFVDLAKAGQRGVKTEDNLASLVSAQMSELKEHGKTLTLSTTASGALSLTAEAGVAEVGVMVQIARQNGLSVWKEADDTYHMTVMDGAKVGVTAEIAAEFKKVINAVSVEVGVRAEAGVDGSLAHGCDLSFPNSAHCQMFLFAMLSRKTSPELLALCKEASLVTEGGIGARASLTATADVSVDEEDALLSAELGAGAEGGITWNQTSSADHTQRSRTVRGSAVLKAEASLNLGVLEENVTDFADSLKDKIAEKAEEAIDAALPGSVPESVTDTVKEKVGDLLDGTSEKVLDAFSSALEEVKQKGEEGVLTAEKSLVFAYEETRTITERNALTSGGRPVLERYERVRAFAPENKAEALDLMREHKVSPSCILAILEHVKDMPATEAFRLELVSTMKDSAVAAYNADPTVKLRGKDSMELTEVRVITEENYQKERGLERGPVSVTVARDFTRTHTASFENK